MLLKEKSNSLVKRIADCTFYLALTIELILVILDKSIYIIQHDGQWFRLTFALFLLKVLLTKHNSKQWLAIGAFVVFGLISYLVTGRNEILRLIVMIAAFKDVDTDRAIKYAFYVTLAGCSILVFLSFFGIGTTSLTRDFGRGEIETRYCLGLGHPNGLHCMYWVLSILFTYIYKDRTRLWIFFALLLGNIGLFALTGSKAGFGITSFSLVMLALAKGGLFTRHKMWIVYGTTISAIVVAMFSFLVMCHRLFWYHLRPIDAYLTGRITWTHMEITQAKTFFWTPFSAVNRGLQTDLGIVKMVYWYGYIPTIITLMASCMLVKSAIKIGDEEVAIIIISAIVYTAFEGYFVSEFLARNFVIVFFAKYWTKMLEIGNRPERYVIDYFRTKKVI